MERVIHFTPHDFSRDIMDKKEHFGFKFQVEDNFLVHIMLALQIYGTETFLFITH